MNARKNTFKKVALKPIAAGVALAAAGVAQAQPMLEEVIVTAQKRVESLQDVPISVSAVSGQTMDDANITNLEAQKEGGGAKANE